MASFLTRLFGKRDKASPETQFSGNEVLNSYIRRLGEISQELGVIGESFQQSASSIKKESGDMLENTMKSMVGLMVPGYSAYNLSEEGLILIKLISVKIAHLKNANHNSMDEKDAKRITGLTEYIAKQEQMLQRTKNQMSPYQSLNANDVVQNIMNRIKNQ